MSSAIVSKSSRLYSTENFVFNLLKNSNCWIDFSDSNYYTTTGTGNLTLASVTDKSNSATTVTIAGTPTFDEGLKSMFNLSSTANYLSIPFSGANTTTNTETVFLVVSQTSAANNPGYYGTAVLGARYVRVAANFNYARAGSSQLVSASTVPHGQVMVLTYLLDRGSLRMYYNGKFDMSGSVTLTANSTPTRIGQAYLNTNILMGNIYEAIFFSDAIPDDQRQLIERYLAQKWKITSTLSSPTSITGCTLWLDGNDASSVTYSSGTNISQWNDKSGNNYHAVQGTAARQPTYNSTTKAVNFVQASTQFMTTTSPYTGSANSEHVYIVFRTNALANANLIGTTDTARGRQIRSAGTRLRIYNGSTASITGLRTSLTTTDKYVVEFINVTGRCLVNINKAVDGNTAKISFAAGTWNQVIGGATTSGAVSYDGDIHEVVIYNRALTGSERTSILNYLYTKWSINIGPTLFSEQPYSSVPPFLRLTIPTDVIGCNLWLDAADATSITLSGSNVSQWNDKSGNANHAIQATPANQPTYSSNGVIFNGSTQNLTTNYSASLQNETMFFVATQTVAPTAGVGRTLIGSSANGGRQLFTWVAQFQVNKQAVNAGPVGGTITQDTRRIFGYICTSGTSNSINLFLDGTSVATGTLATYTTGLTSMIGKWPGSSTEGWVGSINEIIGYNKVISKTERQLIEGYLAQKWGLKPSLPSTHSFITELALTPRFDPRKFSPRLWLDGNNLSSLSLSGSDVTSWTDSSGYSGSSINYSGTPTYSLSTKLLSFDGTVAMQFNSTTANAFFQNVNYMICFAVVSTANINGVIFACSRTGALRFDARFNSQKLQLYARRLDTDGTSALTGSTTIPLNTRMLATFIADTSTNNDLFIYYNGVLDGSSSPFPSTGTTSNTACDFVSVAGRNDLVTHPALNGSIGEVLVYNRFLTILQQQQIEGYLAWNWGLQNNLPSTHPYAKYPPY